MLTHKELERLICGKKTVDFDMLKAHTTYTLDLNENTPRIKWLWEILHEMTDEDKLKFIKFCWAQERLPATNEDYEKSQVHFTIKPYIDKKKKDIFPKADTCFFSFEIPEYSSKEIMKNRIISAINLDNVSINADKVNPEIIQNTNNENRGLRYEEEYEEDEC